MAHGYYEIDKNGVWQEIDPFKKADLVIPVRCKDCKLRYTYDCPIEESGYAAHASDDWYCAGGVRKDE